MGGHLPKYFIFVADPSPHIFILGYSSAPLRVSNGIALTCSNIIIYINPLDEERNFQFEDETGNTYMVSMYHDKKKYDTAVKYCDKKGLQTVRPKTMGAYQVIRELSFLAGGGSIYL